VGAYGGRLNVVLNSGGLYGVLDRVYFEGILKDDGIFVRSLIMRRGIVDWLC